MNTPEQLTDAELNDLAPNRLAFYRQNRYLGDDISVTLSDFQPADRAVVAELYAMLEQLLELLRSHLHTPESGLQQVRAFAERNDWMRFIKRVRAIGQADRGAASPHVLSQVIHDLRGGGFQALSIQLQLLGLGISAPEDMARMFFLTRDHLKIMRNAVRDIDAPKYLRDRDQKSHNVQLLIEKWHHASYKLPDAAAKILLDCRFDGNVSERCLEFAALDRVLYNLINNAVRFAADGYVQLAILPLEADHPANLRFVIANTIAAEQQLALERRYANAMGRLFEGGFTTGGNGLGMRICADFVANAYGLSDVGQALAGGYLGAKLAGPRFVSWFHWPVAAD